jgi:hypothetical protein
VERAPTQEQSTLPVTDPVYEHLATFRNNNPTATWQTRPGARDEPSALQRAVTTPWGDPSLRIPVRDSSEPLIAALNAVFLPPRLSALWHIDSKDLEFIYTPLPVEPEVRERSFSFRFQDRLYRCEFGDASSRLLSIASAAEPTRPGTHTGFRNLQYFGLFPPSKPTSFWIRDVEWDENAVIELAQHLNFYMHYFDRETPRILIHDDPSISKAPSNCVRYPHGPFPSDIIGHTFDAFLLCIWSNTIEGHPCLCFLRSYQILEYAGFYYLPEDLLQTVRKAVLRPDINTRLHETTRLILDVVSDQRGKDEKRIDAVVKRSVDLDTLWGEIQPNLEYFCSPIQFDGGFTVQPFTKKETLNSFKQEGLGKFLEAMHKVRNCLVHARESRACQSIAPTRANYTRLEPWLRPLSLMAMQTILYQEV